jgi:hypothetical protein
VVCPFFVAAERHAGVFACFALILHRAAVEKMTTKHTKHYKELLQIGLGPQAQIG